MPGTGFLPIHRDDFPCLQFSGRRNRQARYTRTAPAGVAVYQGTLTETFFDQARGRNKPVAARHEQRTAGSSRFYPANEGLHQITNRSTANAVSLHVYGVGANLVATGINLIFNDRSA